MIEAAIGRAASHDAATERAAGAHRLVVPDGYAVALLNAVAKGTRSFDDGARDLVVQLERFRARHSFTDEHCRSLILWVDRDHGLDRARALGRSLRGPSAASVTVHLADRRQPLALSACFLAQVSGVAHAGGANVET